MKRLLFLFIPIFAWSQGITVLTTSGGVTAQQIKDSINANATKTAGATGKLTYWGATDSLSNFKWIPFTIVMDSSAIATVDKFLITKTVGAIVVDSLWFGGAGRPGATMSLVPDIHFGVTDSVNGDSVVTTPAAISNLGGGTSVASGSLNNTAIAANKIIWLQFDAVTTKLFKTFMAVIYWHPA